MRVSRCDEGRVAVILHTARWTFATAVIVSLSYFEDKRFHHLLKKTLPFKLLDIDATLITRNSKCWGLRWGLWVCCNRVTPAVVGELAALDDPIPRQYSCR